MKKSKIEWIDGLKGIGCILIFIHHFVLAFYPAAFYGDIAPSHIGFDKMLSVSPISVIINGNYMVHIFCILSSIVITRAFQTKKKEEISDFLMKRYIHFVLLIIPIGLLTFLAIKFHAFSNLEVAEITKSTWLSMHYTQGLPFMLMIQSVLYKTLFTGDYSISTAFWMLNYIFIGTYLVYVINSIFYHRNKKCLFLLGIPLLGMTINNNYLADFIVGYIIYELCMKSNRINKKGLTWLLSIICIGLGLFLGGYPSGVVPNNIYRFLNFQTMFFHHLIGASLLIIGIILNPRVQLLLSKKIFQKVSKISFYVYLLHILVLFSFGTSIFKLFYEMIGKYNISVLLTFISTSIVLIMVSIGYRICYEKELKKLEIWILKKTQLRETKRK